MFGSCLSSEWKLMWFAIFKAEALYNMGEFERALVQYERGTRVRKVESFTIKRNPIEAFKILCLILFLVCFSLYYPSLPQIQNAQLSHNDHQHITIIMIIIIMTWWIEWSPTWQPGPSPSPRDAPVPWHNSQHGQSWIWQRTCPGFFRQNSFISTLN